MPVSGHVDDLVASSIGAVRVREVDTDGVGQEVHRVSGSGPGRKTPAHLAEFMIHSRPRVWKRLRHVGFSSVSVPDHKRRRSDQATGGSNPAQVRTGVG